MEPLGVSKWFDTPTEVADIVKLLLSVEVVLVFIRRRSAVVLFVTASHVRFHHH